MNNEERILDRYTKLSIFSYLLSPISYLPFRFYPIIPCVHIDSDRWYTITGGTMFWWMMLEYTFHRLSYDRFPDLDFVFGDIEDELIVDLEYHRASESVFANFRVYIEHCELQHICGSSLDRHIYPFTLTCRSYHLIGIGEPWDRSPPSESSLHISERSAIFEDRLIVVLHSGVSLIERFYIVLCFPWWSSECLREPESCDPIYHSEIHSLRDATLL